MCQLPDMTNICSPIKTEEVMPQILCESLRSWFPRLATVYCSRLVGGLEPWNFMTFHSVGNVIIPTDELIFF